MSITHPETAKIYSSTNPPLRVAMHNFIRQVTPADISERVNWALTTNLTPEYRESVRRIWVLKLSEKRPDPFGLPIYRFISRFSKINSSEFWSGIAESALSIDRDLSSQLRGTLTEPYEIAEPGIIGDYLYASNIPFLGFATPLMGIAMVYGEGIASLIHVPALNNRRILNAGIEAGKQAGGVTPDIKEVFRRLTVCFPASLKEGPGEESTNSAYSLLEKYLAFEGHHEASQKKNREAFDTRCIGVNLTRQLYEAIGKNLADSNIKDQLIQELTQPTN